MCGFAGVIAWDERYRTSDATLRRMSAAIAHRGPDGEGYHVSPAGEIAPDRPQVALAFRRLAILDPDPRANQPFTDGRHWLVFNGEIYNFRELRKELTQLDPAYEWRTTGDTEVLLRSYAVWRERCVEHLNGMFAFAVWDEREKTLFLARDRMGQKPLYMAWPAGHGPAVAFGSELSALAQVPWFDRTLNQGALVQYLRNGVVNGSDGFTIYRDAVQVTPACARVDRTLPLWSHQYFDPNRPAASPVADRAAATLAREALARAVERQLVSDVPLGVFLSGGIDSSVVTSCARRLGPVSTFSISFDDPRYDEGPYAAEVARHLGTQHHEFRVTPSAAEDLPRLAAVYGEPFADSSALPTHYLARETRRHVKVALSGDGGDELFGGYERYRAMRLERQLRHVPRVVRRVLGGGWTDRFSNSHPKSVAAKARRFVKTVHLPPAQRYASYLRLFDDPTIGSLLPDGRAMPLDAVESSFLLASQGRDAVQTALATDRVTYLPNDLLTKVDRASMLHNLEVRSPFMDHELVTFAAGLTTDQLLKGGPKRMLREAFAADLPDFVFRRRKMGFAVPIGEWFRGELRPMLRDHLFAADSFARGHFHMPVVERLVDEHERQRVDHAQRLYALLMLELWWRIRRAA